MTNFQFADFHCHPTLKTFGQSFSEKEKARGKNTNVWHANPPTFFTKCILKFSGVTRFSQSDLTTMINGDVKIAFVSLYPFENGFFTNPYLNNKFIALLSSMITSIGYKRVRHIQTHLDYFKDLLSEYQFLMRIPLEFVSNNTSYSINMVNSKSDIDFNLKNKNCLSIIPTIEGAHVFNTGLKNFGKEFQEVHIFKNIKKVKKLNHPPLFITFAHNFNNDLCGHAPSLECLGGLVNQNENLNEGFTELGIKVLHHLLDTKNGNPIYIDIKHMSLKSRLEYYDILRIEYALKIPIIMSHGAVTGRSMLGTSKGSLSPEFFANDSINFYDEELVIIAESNGLFAIQLDSKRLASKQLVRKSLWSNNKKINLKFSALIVWRQIQHVAEILDSNGLFAWGTCCIGSDFDGTINPLNEIWTASDLNILANELVLIAEKYISKPNILTQPRNLSISAEIIVSNFAIQNTLSFIERYYP